MSEAAPEGAAAPAPAAPPAAPPEDARVELVDRLPARTPWCRGARVIQQTLGRDMELRIFPAGFTDHQAALFFQELRNLSTLDHPGFVPVHDSLVYKACPCYLVPLREDPTLAELVEDPTFDLAKRAQVVRSLADALAGAHARDILLGPVPPSRIAWNHAAGRAYFLHLGQSPDDWRDPVLAHSPLYGAREPLSEANDVMAWGLLASWFLSGGTPAFPSEGAEAPSLRSRKRELAAGLGMVVEASLALDPELRPEGGGTLRRLLAADPADLAPPDALPPEEIPIDELSRRVHKRLETWNPAAVPAARPAASRPLPGDLEAAFRTPDSGTGTDLGRMTRMASRHGLTLLPDGPVPSRRGGPPGPFDLLKYAVAGGLALGLLVVGLQRMGSSSESGDAQVAQPVRVARRVSRPKPVARPGHDSVEVKELLGYQGDILPEDFEAIWKKLQALVVQKKLPSGVTDGKSMMRLWIQFKRQPKEACETLEGILEKLRKRQAS